jgi:hypothetical protein
MKQYPGAVGRQKSGEQFEALLCVCHLRAMHGGGCGAILVEYQHLGASLHTKQDYVYKTFKQHSTYLLFKFGECLHCHNKRAPIRGVRLDTNVKTSTHKHKQNSPHTARAAAP